MINNKKIMFLIILFSLVFSLTSCFSSSSQLNSTSSKKEVTKNIESSISKTTAYNNTSSKKENTTKKTSKEIEYVNETDNVIAYSVDNTVQIMKNAELEDNYERELIFNLAKGEKETAQLILYNLSNETLTFDYTFSNFKCKENDEVIPGGAISTYLELYQNITTNWSEFNNSPSAWYPYGKEELPLGWFPDALEPFEVSKYKGNNKLDNTNGRNQGLFFILDNDVEAEAGTYIGSLKINFSNSDQLVIKVVINVYDFILKEENHSKYLVAINIDDFTNVYGNRWNDSIYYIEAQNMLRERGISPLNLAGSTWDYSELNNYIGLLKEATLNNKVAAYTLKINYQVFSEIKISYKINVNSKLSETTLNDIPLYVLDDYLYEDGKTVLNGMKSVLERIVNESTNEVNLLKKAILYHPQADEPGNDKGYIQNIINQNTLNLAREHCLENCDFTGKEEVKKSLIDLDYIVTSSPVDRLYNGYYQLEIISYSGENKDCFGLDNLKTKKCFGYCPLFNHFIPSSNYIDKINTMLKDDNYAVWWYGCCQPVYPYPTFTINAPMLVSRVVFAQTFYEGIEGLLYYKANSMSSYKNSQYTYLSENEILDGKSNWEGAVGDGLLIYPQFNTLEEYNKTAKEKVYYYSSLRLENISEGVDDYNYLYYANELIENIKDESTKNSYKTKLNSIMESLFNDPASNTNDSKLFKTKRIELMELIIELKNIK